MTEPIARYLVLSTGVQGLALEGVASDFPTAFNALMASLDQYATTKGGGDPMMVPADLRMATDPANPILCDTWEPQDGAPSPFDFRLLLLDLNKTLGVVVPPTAAEQDAAAQVLIDEPCFLGSARTAYSVARTILAGGAVEASDRPDPKVVGWDDNGDYVDGCPVFHLGDVPGFDELYRYLTGGSEAPAVRDSSAP